MKTADFLRKHDACHEDAEWALSISDEMSAVWDALVKQGKHEWLLWTVTRPGVFPDSTLRKLACRFVRETPLSDGRKVWDLLTDERSRKAIEVEEAYAEGSATKKELADAANAAYDAAYDAADDVAIASYFASARAAADDVAVCAVVAAYAADAAYDAADAAYDAAAWAVWTAAESAGGEAAYSAAESAAESARSAQVRMIAELGNPFKGACP